MPPRHGQQPSPYGRRYDYVTPSPLVQPQNGPVFEVIESAPPMPTAPSAWRSPQQPRPPRSVLQMVGGKPILRQPKPNPSPLGNVYTSTPGAHTPGHFVSTHSNTRYVGSGNLGSALRVTQNSGGKQNTSQVSSKQLWVATPSLQITVPQPPGQRPSLSARPATQRLYLTSALTGSIRSTPTALLTPISSQHMLRSGIDRSHSSLETSGAHSQRRAGFISGVTDQTVRTKYALYDTPPQKLYNTARSDVHDLPDRSITVQPQRQRQTRQQELLMRNYRQQQGPVGKQDLPPLEDLLGKMEQEEPTDKHPAQATRKSGSFKCSVSVSDTTSNKSSCFAGIPPEMITAHTVVEFGGLQPVLPGFTEPSLVEESDDQAENSPFMSSDSLDDESEECNCYDLYGSPTFRTVDRTYMVRKAATDIRTTKSILLPPHRGATNESSCKVTKSSLKASAASICSPEDIFAMDFQEVGGPQTPRTAVDLIHAKGQAITSVTDFIDDDAEVVERSQSLATPHKNSTHVHTLTKPTSFSFYGSRDSQLRPSDVSSLRRILADRRSTMHRGVAGSEMLSISAESMDMQTYDLPDIDTASRSSRHTLSSDGTLNVYNIDLSILFDDPQAGERESISRRPSSIGCLRELRKEFSIPAFLLEARPIPDHRLTISVAEDAVKVITNDGKKTRKTKGLQGKSRRATEQPAPTSRSSRKSMVSPLPQAAITLKKPVDEDIPITPSEQIPPPLKHTEHLAHGACRPRQMLGDDSEVDKQHLITEGVARDDPRVVTSVYSTRESSIGLCATGE
ncbi:hypothetical protein GMRT_13507 [Giardia muris]|uniref:Uncharacterized protein n=1 Tax=Giardia muris TaxID=5742 RepID=A0A4Z1SQM2_GIAMU|nr:hypothetical protein GMRT_13507 [Giardia muris]|eukprot:TNJ27980.1 hypothetical protein GMRT_13507 [Giardia muris]